MVLYGFGGHGRVVADCLESAQLRVAGVFDDHLAAEECPYPLFGQYQPGIQEEAGIILAVGDNKTRKYLAGIIKHKPGFVQHPSAVKSPRSLAGEGTVMLARSVIQTHVEIGKHCIINTGVIVEHDSRIGNFVHIAPAAIVCGGVSIGEGSFVGAGAILLPGIKIGRNCTIGAGAVVVSSVQDGLTYVGNPARQLNKI